MKDIVFDLGAVLIDWNPRYFYRKIFTNEADMEYFLKEICNSAWCLEMDGGKTFAQACAEKAAQYPQYADPIKKYDAGWQEMLGGVVEGTVQILRELKQKGSRVYALTNWSAEKFPIAQAKFDFLNEFDGIVVSGEEKCVNYLSYDASMAFVFLTYKRFAERFEEHVKKTVKMTFYNDIQFRAQNRRMWDESFNEHFENKYGYDPAPYYPVLYGDIAQNTEHYRAAFFSCRTDMLLNGFFKAVSDYTKSVGLISMGDVAEAKTTSAPFIFGDGMKFQSLNGSVGIDRMHRYMYGFNGLKIASSASYNYDIRDVVCEIFGDYNKFDESVIYRETMNAYARGVTKLIAHLPAEMMFSEGQTSDFINNDI